MRNLKKTLIFIILNVIVCQSIIGKTCNSSLDCISKFNSTLCCRNSICQHEDNCTYITKMFYVASGAIGISLIVAAIIYFHIQINILKENVNSIKNEAEADSKKN